MLSEMHELTSVLAEFNSNRLLDSFKEGPSKEEPIKKSKKLKRGAKQ